MRFGLPSVTVSDIASQFYCERKVELRYTIGRIRTKEMMDGATRHVGLVERAAYEPPEKILRSALLGKPTWASEVFLLSKFRNVFVTGKPDAVVFEEGKPLRVVEYKFTGTKTPTHYHHVQARVYCLILKKLGLDTSALRYAIVLIPPDLVPDFRKISKLIVGETSKENVFLWDPDWERARAELDWALQYWRGEREAEPTTNRGRCERCEYREMCV